MSLRLDALLKISSSSDNTSQANSFLGTEPLMSSETTSGNQVPNIVLCQPDFLRTSYNHLECYSESSPSRRDNVSGIDVEEVGARTEFSPALYQIPMAQSAASVRSLSPATAESLQTCELSHSPSSSFDLNSSKSSLKTRIREKPIGICKVCGDIATGKYFGALVCVPCKTFFLRYNGEGFSFVCKNKKACDISVSTRIQCKYCRFQKCLAAGMTRKIRPPQVEPKEGKQLCVVCNDFGNGVHFGVVTCEGCKKFFRRGLVEHKSYVCKFNKCCPINPQTRNTCRYCRYSKCKSLGMSREAIQMGRPSKASQKQGIPRFAEKHQDEAEEVMEIEGSNDEEYDDAQVLDLSIPQSSTLQMASTSATPLVTRRAGMDPSSGTLHFASLPSLQQNTCLPTREISDQSVPSQLLNETPKIVLNNIRYQAEGNQKNLRVNHNPPKRVTMSDLVAAYGANKVNVSYHNKPINVLEDRRPRNNQPNERSKRLMGFPSNNNVLSDGNSFTNHLACEIFDDLIIEHKMRLRMSISRNYWMASLFPDENLHTSDEKHLEIINKIVPNYGEFVTASETINHNLTNNYREWVDKNGLVDASVVSEWIKASVIPAFTIVSVKYCKQIPGFKTFDMMDQVKIACLGQSPSRILAAVLHWFDPALNDFKDFLSWRNRIPGNSDRFKRYLIGFANKVQLLNLDPIEAAILNALIIVASDYPDLIDHKVIESARAKIIRTFRAYITVKYGASSDRLDKLFGIIPEIRKIGFLHHEMTNRKTMMAEEFGERLLKSFNL